MSHAGPTRPSGQGGGRLTSAPWPRLGREFKQRLDARTPTVFTHGLHEHPLLDLDHFARLAEALPAESISAENAEKPLVHDASEAHDVPVAGIGDQIRGLADNSSWFTLLNIEQEPTYRGLVDEVVEAIAASAGLDPASLKRRMGFVFASSPGSVTTAHFDIEHSFLLQLEGSRTLSFGSFPDENVRDEEVRRYWNGSFGRLAAMPEHDSDVDLAPGVGAYIPPYQPHWIQNSDATSLSLTVTFFNRSNADESMAQAFNERVRGLGLDPRRYGDSPGRDRLKVGAMRAYGAAKRRLRPERSTKR
jgi:hypothetical protein